MVAKIILGKKLRGALHYNEHKVVEGQAELILASGFAGNIDQMNFNQKLQRFENLLMLKPSVKTNTLHISLNFDASEKLNDETLQRIAIAYMDKIGFGDQPYLAYRHHDAAHDHIHLVTTNIQANAVPISLHNIGRIKSEEARKEIEQEFNLVKAQSKQYIPAPAIKPIDLQKALYGKLPTKRAISNTVNAVINSYRFTSVAELNAVLKPLNVVADRGAADTQMFQKKGLVYSLLDSNGNKVGVPIKSSSLYTKPTLAHLEKEFALHKANRLPHKASLKEKIDQVLNAGRKPDRQSFTDALKKQGVAVVFRQNDKGDTYGITFVDHNNKTVFNGSDLGKSYTANSITDQFRQAKQTPKQQVQQQLNQMAKLSTQKDWTPSYQPAPVLSALLAPAAPDYSSLLPKKKRKKKRGIRL
jgi:hypothetical protein